MKLKNKLLRHACQKLNRCANTLSVRRFLGVSDPISDLIYRENRAETSYRELINIRRALDQTDGINGEMAEVGVYKGGTAKLIALSQPDVPLHLFDTFNGFPDKTHVIDTLEKGMYKAGLDEVQRYLRDCSNIIYHKGLFSEKVKEMPDGSQFSFVNFDADQYQVTLDALDYFYPRMVSGGRMILHDYGYILTPGVKQAVMDSGGFPLSVELFDHQLLIIKP